MAVTGQRKEENKAAAVVQDVTNIESPAWVNVFVTSLAGVLPSTSNLVHRHTCQQPNKRLCNSLFDFINYKNFRH